VNIRPGKYTLPSRDRCAGAIGAGNAVDQRHAIGLQQRLDGLEELAEVRQPDMFEHADRDNPIEFAGKTLRQGAIIDKLEGYLVRNAHLRGLVAGIFELFFGQCDAQHLGAGDFVDETRHPAPAAADIKDLLPRLQIELCGDMSEFCLLCGVETHLRGVEIGAAVLAMRVEKQVIESVIEVVMVCNIAF
jgi:hypothetical protein